MKITKLGRKRRDLTKRLLSRISIRWIWIPGNDSTEECRLLSSGWMTAVVEYSILWRRRGRRRFPGCCSSWRLELHVRFSVFIFVVGFIFFNLAWKWATKNIVKFWLLLSRARWTVELRDLCFSGVSFHWLPFAEDDWHAKTYQSTTLSSISVFLLNMDSWSEKMTAA